MDVGIAGVVVIPLKKYEDARGWLTELFRADELPEGFTPAMAYLSVTKPGVARGPHEHVVQSDGFAFLDGSYRLYLWENREGHLPQRVVLDVGEHNPVAVFVPPGVAHAYKNCGEREAFVVNFPDQLYAGWGKQGPVDEIRHENDPASAFHLD
jgi:dTDP-4-dehydrorhamnose 3,5-epimerase